jgi:hypothetical protein
MHFVHSQHTLWDLRIWFWLDGMDQIGKFDCILDEEDRNIVSNNIYQQVWLGGEHSQEEL